jgi:hypothetical protein
MLGPYRLVAQMPSPDLFICAKDLFVEANDGPLAPLHCWLTNRINAPTPINTAIRIPTIKNHRPWKAHVQGRRHGSNLISQKTNTSPGS